MKGLNESSGIQLGYTFKSCRELLKTSMSSPNLRFWFNWFRVGDPEADILKIPSVILMCDWG